jgi:hypothetical protein
MSEYLLTLEFNLNNDGFMIQTYWFDLAMPMRTILLAITIWAGVKLIKSRKKSIRTDTRTNDYLDDDYLDDEWSF